MCSCSPSHAQLTCCIVLINFALTSVKAAAHLRHTRTFNILTFSQYIYLPAGKQNSSEFSRLIAQVRDRLGTSRQVQIKQEGTAEEEDTPDTSTTGTTFQEYLTAVTVSLSCTSLTGSEPAPLIQPCVHLLLESYMTCEVTGRAASQNCAEGSCGMAGASHSADSRLHPPQLSDDVFVSDRRAVGH